MGWLLVMLAPCEATVISQLGRLVGGGVAEPVRHADRSGDQPSGGQQALRGA
jgi:hypothetical protein